MTIQVCASKFNEVLCAGIRAWRFAIPFKSLFLQAMALVIVVSHNAFRPIRQRNWLALAEKL